MTVNELAARLEIASATASLMIGDLSRYGVLDRTEDPDDRRHATPLSPAERALVINTLKVFEQHSS